MPSKSDLSRGFRKIPKPGRRKPKRRIPSQELQIPDPKQLSIPSEPRVRGSFAERVTKTFTNKNRDTLASILADRATKDIGNAIVLSQILKQLESLPAAPSPNLNLSLPGFDILDFGNKKDFVAKSDLIQSKMRKRDI